MEMSSEEKMARSIIVKMLCDKKLNDDVAITELLNTLDDYYYEERPWLYKIFTQMSMDHEGLINAKFSENDSGRLVWDKQFPAVFWLTVAGQEAFKSHKYI